MLNGVWHFFFVCMESFSFFSYTISMKILALDDCELALESLVQAIKEAVPGAEIFPFRKPALLIEAAKGKTWDIAFLDIQMFGMNGLEVAKILKDNYSKTNIIFVTAFAKHAKNAFELYPSGYVLKPVTKEAVLREVENLRHPLIPPVSDKVQVQTFGNFDVFLKGKPLIFNRLKAKEAFAYLIDKKGASVTTAEMASMLWEDREYDRSLQNQTQVIISEMMKVLKVNGISDIIIKNHNQISIDTAKIKCDYYDFLNFDVTAVNTYHGEYMSNYSWAEMTAGELYSKSKKK